MVTLYDDVTKRGCLPWRQMRRSRGGAGSGVTLLLCGCLVTDVNQRRLGVMYDVILYDVRDAETHNRIRVGSYSCASV